MQTLQQSSAGCDNQRWLLTPGGICSGVKRNAAQAPVDEYSAPAPAMTYAAPAPVAEHSAPAPAETYAAPAPVSEHAAPAQLEPQERFQPRTDELIVAVPVSQVVEEAVQVGISERIMEQSVDVPLVAAPAPVPDVPVPASAFRVGDLGYDVSSCRHCEIIRIGMGCTSTKSASSSRTKTPARIFTHRFIPDAKRLCLDADRR